MTAKEWWKRAAIGLAGGLLALPLYVLIATSMHWFQRPVWLARPFWTSVLMLICGYPLANIIERWVIIDYRAPFVGILDDLLKFGLTPVILCVTWLLLSPSIPHRKVVRALVALPWIAFWFYTFLEVTKGF